MRLLSLIKMLAEPLWKIVMRYLLVVIFSAIMLAGCQSLDLPGYQINELATAQAQWKPGEVVAKGEVDWGEVIENNNFYRKFIGITDKGYAVVQDFYAGSDNKFTNPYVVMQPSRIGDIGLVKEEVEKRSSTLLDGILTLWYENGQKRFEAHYLDGKPHGVSTEWNENGQKWFEVHFQDGKLLCLLIVWYENGQKESEGHIQDGEAQGLWTYWDENGKKIGEVLYEAGQVVSETYF